MALSFLGKWFGGQRADAPVVDEVRAELTRLAAERPAFAAPLRWLCELLPDLVPVEAPLPCPTLEPAQARAKLASGIPLLRGEQLTIDAKAFRQRWQRACAALEAIQPDGAAAALAKAVQRGDVDSAALVETIVNGQPEDVRQHLEALNLDPVLATTLLRFSLFPVFSALSAHLSPLREGTVWERGYCPTCGSWPLLGEFRGLDQARYLRCGLCAAGWEAPRLWCPFCENRDHERLSFLHAEGEELKHRAATCDECRGYVKMVTTLSALPPLALLLADVATLHLDLAAAERGFTNIG